MSFDPSPVSRTMPSGDVLEPGFAASAPSEVDLLDEPVLGLTADGALLLANGPARRLLDRGDTLMQRAGHPVPVDDTLRSRWRAVLHDVLAGRRRMLCSARPDGRPILLRPGAGDVRVIVRIGRDPTARIQAVRCYAESIGLTGQETRILEALVDGQSPAAIACRHGVSLSTVRTQIRATIDKAGARGTRGLIATVARVLQ